MALQSMREGILYLSYDGLTDPLGQSQILPYLFGLAKRGYVISILSFEKPGRYTHEGLSVRSQCNALGIAWYPLVYHKRPPVLSTLYDLFTLWRTARRLVIDKSIAIVHCRSYLTALVGLRLKRKTGVKFIFDMRGFWADERTEGHIWSLDNFLYRQIYNFFKRAERRLVKQADRVIVLTQAAKDEIDNWHLSDRLDVIPCCVDMDLFNPARITEARKDQLRSALGIGKDHFVLLYLGSLGTWYMADEMLSFYQKLRMEKPNARFLVLTPDVNSIGGEGIIVRTVRRDEVPDHIAIADASICFIRPTFSKKGSSATKMAEVLAMNVPIISNKGWGDVEFLQSRVNGLLLTSKADVVPRDLFQYFSDRPSQTAFFSRYFSLEQGISRYHEIYRSLLREQL